KAKKEAGVFQGLLKRDRIFHVVLKAPMVVDDSMECEFSLMSDKKLGVVRCRSQFYPQKKFMVRDIPLVNQSGEMVVFGAPKKNEYDYSGEWEKTNAVAISKVQEIVREMGVLKKKNFAENLAAVYNIGLPKTSGLNNPFVLNANNN